MPSMRMQRRQGTFPMFPFARGLDQLQANVRRMFDNPLTFPDLLTTPPQPLAWTPPWWLRCLICRIRTCKHKLRAAEPSACLY